MQHINEGLQTQPQQHAPQYDGQREGQERQKQHATMQLRPDCTYQRRKNKIHERPFSAIIRARLEIVAGSAC
jgi:hypothetical protein